MDIPLLGVHCSISGGYINAISEAQRLGIDTFQIFTKNQRQWKEKVVTDAEASAFKIAANNAGVERMVSHCSYLINLGSPDENHRNMSILALIEELNRCFSLGIQNTVLHPGSGKGTGEAQTLQYISEALNLTITKTPNIPSAILLENTCGQGSNIGGTFSQLGSIINQFNNNRIGVCLDICHAFAAGYDIRTEKGIESLFNEIERYIGLERLHVIHLNDSKGDLGSKIDRHAHIGEGKLGKIPFQFILNNFSHIPKIIETSKENDMDNKNLNNLRLLNQ